MKKEWFFMFLKKSIMQRKGRVIIASLSITLAVAVISGMTGITAGVRDKLGEELKAYGANIIVSPAEGTYIDSGTLDRIRKVSNVINAEGQIFDSVIINGQAVEIIGLNISSLKDTGWRLSGKWPENRGGILAGINLKNALELDAGNNVTLLSSSEGSAEFTITGFIERGGAEDNTFILSIADVWKLTGLDSKLSTILVRGDPGKLENAVNSIKDAFPSVNVKTFRQIAFAEESLLGKIQLLMVLVTIAVLFASIISIGSTMGANVIERREEIGLMMAIGATKNQISMIYAAEAVLIGLLGGIAGFVLAYISAQVISKGAFGSYISMPFYTFFLSMITGLALSMLASHFPVRDALKYSPAEILRGE